MSDDTTRRVRAQIEAAAAAVTAAVDHFEHDEHDEHDCAELGTIGDLWEWIDTDILEIRTVWEGSLTGAPDLSAIRLVLCTGGPHVEMRYNGHTASFHGWDWFGSGEQTVTGDDCANTLGDRLWTLAEDMREEVRR